MFSYTCVVGESFHVVGFVPDTVCLGYTGITRVYTLLLYGPGFFVMNDEVFHY